MRFVWMTALKDLRCLRRDPLSLATWMGIPLILVLMLKLVFGGGSGGPLPKGRLLVADEDDTFASSMVTGAFLREPLSEMVLVEKVKRAEGRARIDRGDASAFLIIPKGLQEAFLHRQPFRLQLFTNPSERILPQIIEESLSVMVEGGFYVQRAAGGELLALSGSQALGGQAAFTGVYQRIAGLRKFWNPSLIELDMAVAQEKKQTKGFAAMFLPSMLYMSIWMMTGVLAGEIWKERAQGTLRRVAVAPVRLAEFLAGRLLFVALVFAFVALAGLGIAHWLAGVPAPNLLAAAAWVTLSGVVFYLLLLLVSMQASSEHAAEVLVNVVAFPLALVGGCFFPFEIMPGWMAAIGRLTPNGWAVSEFTAILSGSVRTWELAAAIAGLAAVSLLAFLQALLRMRRSFLL
jgi:ABC-2 type transport system permease protein